MKIENESLKYQEEFESSFDHTKVVSTAIDVISFIAKAAHFLSAERIDRLKPSLNEELWSLCDLKPTPSEYLFGENMNGSLKLAKENYKLSQNFVSNQGIKQQDPHQGQVLNEHHIMKLETVFLLEPNSL